MRPLNGVAITHIPEVVLRDTYLNKISVGTLVVEQENIVGPETNCCATFQLQKKKCLHELKVRPDK